jgi:tetratricopeptide (TPR) repeat protein
MTFGELHVAENNYRDMKQLKLLLPFLLLITGWMQLNAQSTAIYNDPDAEFKTAKDWFQQEKFSLAFPVFKHLYSNSVASSNFPEQLFSESHYYYIACGLKLQDSTAESLAEDFIQLDTHRPLVQRMSFVLGEFYFQRKDYVKAQNIYEQTNIDNLSNAEIASLKFHSAYSYFVMKQFDKAKPLFNVVRQLNKDPNYIEANYYYGFICFYEKNYKEALAAFKVAEKNPDYSMVIPFYLSEIYYFNGQRDLALEIGEKALQTGKQFYDLQMRQLVGHILFEQRNFERAQPYLEKYVSGSDKVRREDLYELSYCYYEASNWKPAIEGLKQLGGGEDSLAQNSMYLLANAYLKINDKINARNAFQFCASNTSNAFQKEVATFNYAKLSYDLNYYDIASKGLQSFIGNYPKSIYIPEAKEILINTLANTSDYEEALNLFNKLSVKSEEIKKIYPSILYGRSVEMINDHQFVSADSLLSILMATPNNSQQLALSSFWRGEIAYRSNNLDDAIVYFSNYLKTPKNSGQASVVNAHYSLAYAYLKKENYALAKDHFEQVVSFINTNSSATEQDAYLRSADCDFMKKDFKQALKKYDQIINLQLAASDYALFQKAIIAGALNNASEKINLLQSLTGKYSNSNLVADAQLELANTYLANENYAAAIPPLERIIEQKNTESYLPLVYLKLGVANFNMEKNQESLNYFKKLVSNYPNSQESSEAIEYIRTLFVARQQAGDYVSFMKQNGIDVSVNEADSLSYKSATLRFEAKDFVAAQRGFIQYIKDFPDGKYFIDANYFAAEILFQNKENLKALDFYLAVADKSPNKYAERSCLQTARIYFFDLKDYEKASTYFAKLKSIATQQENRLESMRGLLRCQFKTQQWTDAAPNAKELLKEKGIANDDLMMANMVLAKNNQSSNNLDQASINYKQVIAAGRSEYAAESQYRLAEIQFQQHQLAIAEKSAFEVIKKWGSYDLWVAKSYVLLGDIYFEQKDLFNAEATFKSIVENTINADIKKEAQTKLDAVIVEKNKTNKIEQQ